MNENKNNPASCELLLREYDTLRLEIAERIKIAFMHVAVAGAIAAFAVPEADDVPISALIYVKIGLAVVGILALGWVAWLNMRWVQHCNAHLRTVETRLNAYVGGDVLGWHRYASEVQQRLKMLMPPRAR